MSILTRSLFFVCLIYIFDIIILLIWSCETPFFKVLLLQWILMVFDLIDDLKDVHSMYGIFFNFLDSIMLVS